MPHKTQVGILGIGTYLPEQKRGNDWWPEEIVQKWQAQAAKSLLRPKQRDDIAISEGARLALQAMEEIRDDPFKGFVERRVRADDMPSSVMETAAAKEAIARADIDPKEIGLLLSYTSLPDHVLVPTAPLTHQALGLSRECLSTNVEGVCNSFMLQLVFAQQMIQSGTCKYALLIQASGLTKLLPRDQPFSPWMGDGATAVVVGAVSEGLGLQGIAHYTDGSVYNGMIAGNPDGRWHDGHQPRLWVADFPTARRMTLSLPEYGKEALLRAMEKAGVTPDDVDFLATHQGASWLRRVSHALMGFGDKVRSADTYRWTASLGACNVPFCLATGEREGLLKQGDLVAAWGGGAGITWSGFVLRWGK